MKKLSKILLFIFTILFINTLLFGQTTDLFFSEYIEGSSYNKALEIFNGTGMDIDLSNYQLWQIGNGGNWPEYTVDISGILADGEVFVVCHPSANPAMLAVADLVVTLYHNGNDAQGLAKDDGTGTFYLIDTIGEEGEAPEYGWDVAGVLEATKDHTLVRKASIGNPDTDWNSSAGTNADNSEWIVYDKDTFDYLGSHTFTGGGEDTTPPTLVSANATSSTTINLVFSEKISQETAEVISNYSINGLTVSSANLQVDSITVGLTTLEQTEGETYTITVNNIEDLAGNQIVPNSTINFTGYQSGGEENDLFFSEYIEGSSNNKALEIYNGTGATIDLSNYRIVGSYNGSGWQSTYYSFPEETNLPNGDVWVIANEDAAQTILDVANDILAYNEGGYVVSFNGNDARGLEKTSDGGQTWTLIDVIGIPTEDPGDGQGWAVAGVTNATKEHTLVRKSTVTSGNTDWSSSAGTNEDNSEWIVYPQDTFEYLGSHDTSVEDTIPPTLVSANATSSTTVNLVFSEKVSPETAEVISNYSISELTVSSAELQTDGKTITLTTSEQTEGKTYTITVNNVKDLAGNPIVLGSTIDFTGYQPGVGNDLFFSEYIEGSSNNKAIEIYNGTGITIDFSSYRVVGSYNGGGWNSTYYSFPVGSNLENGDVWVIANEGATQAILNVADDILAYNEGGYVVSFNGNDARGLEKTTDGGSTWILIDVIGIPNENPGDDCGWEIAGVGDATLNHTLIRKNSVTNGNTDWATSAGINENDSEWIVHPQDTFEYLGSHGGATQGNVEFPTEPVPANEPANITFTSQDSCNSVELFWNTIKGNDFKSTCMNFIDSTQYSYTAEIPGQSEGTIVYFYITASDTSDSVSYFPENAPQELYQYEYEVASLKAILKVPPRTFCPALNEKFEIQVHSRKDDKIILRLYNSEGKLVYTFFNKLSNGSESFEWDGKDESWNTLPPGLYICHLEVIDRNTGKTKTEVVPIVIAVPLKD
ncbi:MAG: lamin tail domain-containing protein [Candidatus Cloacimonetes bacterium]|nr:lamin tail domain-containing protein [Candidatus Cloacimonadota bacterium]